MTKISRLPVSIAILLRYAEAFYPTSHCALCPINHGYESSSLAYQLVGLRRPTTHLFQSSIGDGASKDSALSTTRIPLARIFNGEREYLFSTRRNVRSFEWSSAELEDLFESILSLSEDDDALELNVVLILPQPITDEYRINFGRSSQHYDVHDGQQRLVSLSLFLAATRDYFLSLGEEFDGDAREVSQAIYPTKARLDPVARIQLRERNGKWLDYLLSRKDENGDDFPKPDAIPLPKPRSRKHLTDSDVLILEAYEYFNRRISELTPEESLDLLDNFMSKTYILMCIPSSTQIARNWVLSLGKGKNLEPVDEFKSLLCFKCIKDEHLQDKALDEWDRACQDMGRSNIESACMMIAQQWLQRRSYKNGEITLMEDFLKDFMESNKDCNGSDLFRSTIAPAGKALKNFRNGHIDLLHPTTRNNGTKKNNSQFVPRELPSLSFLRDAAQISTSKEIEMDVLQLLIAWSSATDDSVKMRIQTDLHRLETVALWMMLAKPKPAVRLQRCFEIIEQCNREYGPKIVSSKVSKTTASNSSTSALDLTQEEILACIEKLDDFSFGATAAGVKVAKAILERLNEYELITSSQGRVSPIERTLQLEHVLPRKFESNPVWAAVWPPEDPQSDTWMHRIGNLALLNQRINSKISNGSFESKKVFLGQSPYPLTREVSKHSMWDIEAVQYRHSKIIELAKHVWHLDEELAQKPAAV